MWNPLTIEPDIRPDTRYPAAGYPANAVSGATLVIMWWIDQLLIKELTINHVKNWSIFILVLQYWLTRLLGHNAHGEIQLLTNYIQIILKQNMLKYLQVIIISDLIINCEDCLFILSRVSFSPQYFSVPFMLLI